MVCVRPECGIRYLHELSESVAKAAKIGSSASGNERPAEAAEACPGKKDRRRLVRLREAISKRVRLVEQVSVFRSRFIVLHTDGMLRPSSGSSRRQRHFIRQFHRQIGSMRLQRLIDLLRTKPVASGTRGN
jgi:hypothetical protein